MCMNEAELALEMERMEALDRFIEGEDPGTTPLSAMAERGWVAPNPDEIAGEDTSRLLTDMVWNLHDLGIVIEWTDHLSDQDLYRELFEFANEPTYLCPEDTNSLLHYSPIGGCSEEDNQIYLRYYLGEKERRQWSEDYPGDPMPPAELPPYPRPWIPDGSARRTQTRK